MGKEQELELERKAGARLFPAVGHSALLPFFLASGTNLVDVLGGRLDEVTL